MIGEHWREPRFWLWWIKQGGPPEVRVILALIGVAVALGGGVLAADRLSQASAGVSPTSQFTFLTTVQREVTVRENDRTVVRGIPIVRRVVVRPQTVYETRVRTNILTEPGDVRVVTKPVTRHVPTVQRQVVTVAGKRQIRTRTVLVPTTRIQTITNAQTVVSHDTATVVTTVPVTATVRQATTVVSTQTLPAQTVTATRTVTQSQTVTAPGVTVTVPLVTVTFPVPKP
jgi:hypothetical protein